MTYAGSDTLGEGVADAPLAEGVLAVGVGDALPFDPPEPEPHAARRQPAARTAKARGYEYTVQRYIMLELSR